VLPDVPEGEWVLPMLVTFDAFHNNYPKIVRISQINLDLAADSLALSVTLVESVRMIVKEKNASTGATSPVIDDVSKAIIEQLQQDGRRPYASIGKAVGLSEAAVRQRVQRLTDTGVMQIVAVTDPLQVGFTRSAMLAVHVEGDVEAVAEQMEQLSEVDYLVICAGSFDILAEVVAEDDEHLLELVNRRIRSIPGVRSTETFVYLKLRKQTYTWGTR
jgi:Lrp/AsnC family transcriptional regulator, regulator for asnA, asnC and gidA